MPATCPLATPKRGDVGDREIRERRQYRDGRRTLNRDQRGRVADVLEAARVRH